MLVASFESFRALIGPSGVRALPLAAGINEAGHYFRYIGPSALRAPAEQLRWPLFWSERVACASGATKVATILGIFPFLLLTLTLTLHTPIQNPRRGCRIVSNFCMWS